MPQEHQDGLLGDDNIVGLLVPALAGSCSVSWQAAVDVLLAKLLPYQVSLFTMLDAACASIQNLNRSQDPKV